MGLTILRGRAFRRTDSADAPGVAVINEQFARHYWPDQDPIGKRFRVNDAQGAWMQIVGLAKTSKYTFLAEKPMEFLSIFVPSAASAAHDPVDDFCRRCGGSCGADPDLVHRLDPGQPIYNVRTMEEFYRLRVVRAFNVVIGSVAAMGIMGLALSSSGCTVSWRTRSPGGRRRLAFAWPSAPAARMSCE